MYYPVSNVFELIKNAGNSNHLYHWLLSVVESILLSDIGCV